ncbi:MAG: putative nicotinate-nucleotide adenylyltransferase [Firmicutes bacterium ADurb.Bin300]|jgi:predicted HD superfamily hydrolase involved in NAD metabolism|nr:MAG: putative nicotinate-nucleotide adenylyltransferase [Firmicutes bacterium ADurb.Bin300]HOD02548.1 bis(5'-nucleosyl)-tetraphosphatase (symmetrical) YqeK [Clostridiales bacterium]
MIKREQEFKNAIRARLSDDRYEHSLNVADECRKLAKMYGADEDKTYTAGLLHDILKDTELTKQRDYLAINGVTLEDYELMAPKLWHAVAGAFFVKEELYVYDNEIVDAIRCHTTGRRYMTLLDKILYTADYISKDRSYDCVDSMRQKAYKGLEYAVLEGLQYTIKKLISGRYVIHPDTIGAYNQTLREVLILEVAASSEAARDSRNEGVI